MNYWIKYILAVQLVFILVSVGTTQDSLIVDIRGVHSWLNEPISKSMEFSFVENGVTCGPNAEFESIDDQYYYFIYELLKDEELVKNIKEMDYASNYYSTQPKKTYSYTYKSEEDMKLIYKLAEKAFAEDFKFYDHYKENDWTDEYDIAVAALINAQESAEALAKAQGYTTVEIVSIDDNTSARIGLRPRSSYRSTKMGAQYNTEGGLPKTYLLDVKFKLSK